MEYLNNIDIIIISIFLLANIAIGLIAGDKVKPLRQYAIASKNFSTGTLTSTIVALILLDYSKDQDAIVSALLHDTVEDTIPFANPSQLW